MTVRASSSSADSVRYTNATSAVSRRLPTANTSITISSSQPQPGKATNLQAANSCWAQWDAYSSSSADCLLTTLSSTTETFTNTWASTIDETYRLCDGHPRANVTAGYSTSLSTAAFGNSTFTTYTERLPPEGIPVSTSTDIFTSITTLFSTACVTSIPTPSCSIDASDCSALFSEWTAGGFSRGRPQCTTPIAKNRNPCNACALHIPFVKLLYFPVTMTGDFCGNYTTATPSQAVNYSIPTTVEVSGTTFTSGYAYYSYAGITAIGESGNCGTPKPAGLLPVPSSEVSSYRGHAAALSMMGGARLPFNFADLAPNPVPWDAWISQETCYTAQDQSQCQTITQEAYAPWLVYPRAFWSMEPDWANCNSDIFGIMDPPTALPTATAIAVPTVPAPPTTQTLDASPASSPSQTLATQTPAVLTASAIGLPSSDSVVQTEASVQSLASPSIVASSSPANAGAPAPEFSATEYSQHATVYIASSTTIASDAYTSSDFTSVVSSAIPLTTNAATQNALSVLESAQTAGFDPIVDVTISGQIFTAYSGGVIAASSTTVMGVGSYIATVAGLTVIVIDGGLIFDSSTLTYSTQNPTIQLSPHLQSPSGSTSPTTTNSGDLAQAIASGIDATHPSSESMSFEPDSTYVTALDYSSVDQIHTIASISGAWVVDGHTVQQGQGPATVGGETFSAAQSGIVFAAQGTTMTVPYSAITTPEASIASDAVMTLESSTTAASAYLDPSGNTALVLGSTTYTYKGSAISADGMSFLVQSSKLIAFDGSSTATASLHVPSLASLPSIAIPPSATTLPGQSITDGPSIGPSPNSPSASTTTTSGCRRSQVSAGMSLMMYLVVLLVVQSAVVIIW